MRSLLSHAVGICDDAARRLDYEHVWQACRVEGRQLAGSSAGGPSCHRCSTVRRPETPYYDAIARTLGKRMYVFRSLNGRSRMENTPIGNAVCTSSGRWRQLSPLSCMSASPDRPPNM